MERVLTDNGACYQYFVWRDACAELNIKHRRTRPYRSQTNGKAERFIRSALNEWAYAKTYAHSHERTAALALWINWYNAIRSHSALGKISPAKWLAQYGYNVSVLNIYYRNRPSCIHLNDVVVAAIVKRFKYMKYTILADSFDKFKLLTGVIYENTGKKRHHPQTESS